MTTNVTERVSERSALLYDTAASLRLLDRELRALDGDPAEAPDEPDAQASGPAAPPAVLERAGAEVQAALAALRAGRAAQDPSIAAQRLDDAEARLLQLARLLDPAAAPG